MVDLYNTRILYTRSEIMILNNISLILDAFIVAGFIMYFFEVKDSKYRDRRFIMLLGIIGGIASIAADIFSKNDYWIYYGVAVLVPFVYEMILCRGKLAMKLIMPVYLLVLLSFLERIVVTAMPYFFKSGMVSYGVYIGLFVIRRFGTKIVLALILRYLLGRMDRNWNQVPVFGWFAMALICVLANVVGELLGKNEAEIDVRLNIAVLVSFIVLLVCMFQMINQLVDAEEKVKTNLAVLQQEQFQKRYNAQVSEMSESLRRFRHDWKQHLFCMDTLLMNQEYDELHDYLLKLHQMSTEGMHIIQYCTNPSLNVILNQKQAAAAKLGILFTASVSLPEKGKIQQEDLNTVVFNLLDNAIEAAARVEKSFVKIDIREAKAYLQIEVDNSVDRDILKVNPSMETIKRDKEFHGMGLKIVKSIVKKYQGIYEVEGDEYTFRSKILLLDH